MNKLTERMTALIASLLQEANDVRHTKDCFVQTLEHEHRTNQQTITNFLLQWFVHLAQMKRKDACDLRNKAAVGLGYEIVEKVLAPRMGYDSPEEFLEKVDKCFSSGRFLPFM
jgi:hypothetical protein